MDRRQFLKLGVAAGATLALPELDWASKPEKPGSFDFLFLTDTHIQPELAAAEGCGMCFKKAGSLHADFALQGGDHVFDSLAVDRKRVDMLFDLYARTEQTLGMKVYHTLGNHDVFGVLPKSGIEVADPAYGKNLFRERIGPTYYSFDHKGYHFIVLDSIQVLEDRTWEGGIDAPQMAWLAKDLAAVAPETPIIISVHVPMATGAAAYLKPQPAKARQLMVNNAFEVVPLFENHNVLAVLQGHLHLNEMVNYKGVTYLTRGAVCGNWWHGPRMGVPEGFTVVSLRKGKISWRYETYGFKSIAPEKD